MKKLFVIVTLLLITTTLGFAQKGYYLEQKVTTSSVMGQPAKEFISKNWILDNRFRSESDEQITIFRFDLKKVWMINTQKKQYNEMSMDEMRQMAQMGHAMMQNVEGVNFKFRKTGRTKKINQWNCYEVASDVKMMKQSIWLTEDLPFGKDVYYNFYKEMPEFRDLAESIYKSEELNGYPVLSETEINMMGMKIQSSSELITIREEKIDSGLFDLPGGLEKVANPLEMLNEAEYE